MKRWMLPVCWLLFTSPLLAKAQQDTQTYKQTIEGTKAVIDMVMVPGGQFMMGSPAKEKKRKADEGPQHEVKLSSFYISRYEITWDLYEMFVYSDYDPTKYLDTAYNTVDAVTRPTKPYLDMTFGMGKEGYPAVGMTQYNAIQFCKWLYTRTGIFYRLPTEAEWEYACRAGTATPYFFGRKAKKLGSYAWYKSNSLNKTHPVGGKSPNAWGLHDMNGNVAEWTMDQYDAGYYKKLSGTVAENPVAAAGKLYAHVIRGGSYADAAPELRSASRGKSDPAWKRKDPQVPKSNWWFPEAPFVGIRIVRPAVTPSRQEIEKYYNVKAIPDY
jgi:formylglycine-generating enzyme